MHPRDEIKRDRKPHVWAPEPLHVPAPNPLEHRDDTGEMPIRAPKPLPGSHVIVIDIS